MTTKKKKKEEAYVASSLNIKYSVPVGLIHLLSAVSKKDKREVWCILSELANICATRLSEKCSSWGDSWTKKKFPDTDVELRIDMKKCTARNYVNGKYDEKGSYYYAKFKINGMREESFTQEQINDYITEKILLGDDEELEQLS